MSLRIEKRIYDLERKAKNLNKLRTITNAIKANLIYMDKNLEQESKQIESLRITDKQKNILAKAWELKKKELLYCLMN